MRLNSMRKLSFWAAIAVGALTCNACMSTETVDTDELIQEAFDNYMSTLDNVYRQEGGYWIEPISDLKSPETGTASNEGECWVRYNFTSRSLIGDLCHTRNEAQARQEGTFNYTTYYSPISLFLTDDWSNDDYEYYNYYYFYQDMVDTYTNDDFAINMALMTTELTIDGEVVNLYEGDKFNIYMPYHLRGSYYNGNGGYAGYTSLGSYRPMVSEIEIVDIIPDASAWESEQIETFMNKNLGDWVLVQYDDDGDGEDDDVEGLYINYDYTPETTYVFTKEYDYGEMPSYAYYGIEGLKDLDEAINTDLIDEYGTGESDGDYVGEEDEASIWYILRTLDGFILDTNITAVGTYAFGSTSNCGTALGYSAEDDYSDYIDAWFYAVPKLKYGAWASILTTSDYAYGVYGLDNTNATTEIAPNTPLLFVVYVEEYEEDWE